MLRVIAWRYVCGGQKPTDYSHPGAVFAPLHLSEVAMLCCFSHFQNIAHMWSWRLALTLASVPLSCLGINIPSFCFCHVTPRRQRPGWPNPSNQAPPRGVFVNHIREDRLKVLWGTPASGCNLLPSHILRAHEFAQKTDCSQDQSRGGTAAGGEPPQNPSDFPCSQFI